MSIREELQREFSKGIATKREGLIEAGLPEDFDIRHVHRAIYPGGVEVYSYRGEEFLELHPPQFETVREEHATKIKSVWNYRYLNGKGPRVTDKQPGPC